MPFEYTWVTGSIQRLNSERSSSVSAMPKCSGYTYSVMTFIACGGGQGGYGKST